MSTYLLAWNPRSFDWKELPQQLEDFKKGKTVVTRWSCGNNRKPTIGDRFLMIRLGVEPRGIFAYGSIVSEVFSAKHWNPKGELDQANYVQIGFEFLIDPESDGILKRQMLLSEAPFAAVHWDIQASGVSVPDAVGNAVVSRLEVKGETKRFYYPEEIPAPDTLMEGASTYIVVNSYERNTIAREKCIEHYGYTCSTCDRSMEELYGKHGKEFIHVHHIKPLSEIGVEYIVDPIADLRPVCPNCHAILHRGMTTMGIEQLRKHLADQKQV